LRAWAALKAYGENPLGAEMLMLRDVAERINRLVEADRKLAELEAVLNDTGMSDRRVIERLSEVFYD
jgi:hypothetical protein